MNIAFVLSYLADRFGGPVAVAKGTGAELASMGHGVSYWATGTDGDRQELKFLQGAHLYDVDWPRSWYRSKGLTRGLQAEISSFDVLELNEFWLHPIYASSRIAIDADVPYILRPAGSLQSWALTRSLAKHIKKSIYLGLIGNSIIRNAACIHAASDFEAEAVRRLGYEGPVAIIPNGLNISEFRGLEGSEAESYWLDLKGRPVVLFMSRLSSEKGLDLLIPVWAEVVSSASQKDALLVIAGPDHGGYRRVVQAMIDRYSVQKNVMMLDMVQGRKKASLLRRADVFVLPSYSENFGIVVAEALACGTPVVTTTATPWKMLHQMGAGRCVPPRRLELLQAIREMLNLSSSRRSEMGRNGMQFIENEFTWEKTARKFLHVCDCVLRGKTIPLHPASAS